MLASETMPNERILSPHFSEALGHSSVWIIVESGSG